MRKYKIFFSYTLRDCEISVDILVGLKKIFEMFGNVETYFDILDNHAVNHQEYVYKVLDSADVLCLIMSSSVNASCWVSKELEVAARKKIEIVEMEKEDIKDILNCKTKEAVLLNKKVRKLLKMDIANDK